MLSPECQSARMSKITNDCLTRSAWHRMLYSCTHMATLGVKGSNDRDVIFAAVTQISTYD